jgi:hypothetical protein
VCVVYRYREKDFLTAYTSASDHSGGGIWASAQRAVYFAEVSMVPLKAAGGAAEHISPAAGHADRT